MTVEEAIVLLSKMDRRALLVINGETPVDVKPLNGKIVEGYFGKGLQENPKGDPNVRYQAVTFVHHTEISTGDVILHHHW